MNPLSIPRSKRRPLADSSMQLQQQCGLRAITGDLYESEKYRVQRTTDPDYPWLLTRLGPGVAGQCVDIDGNWWHERGSCAGCRLGEPQKLASLIEAVDVLKREGIDANRRRGAKDAHPSPIP